jgi:hypothetical protein
METYRLIPLLTPLKSRRTVPLNCIWMLVIWNRHSFYESLVAAYETLFCFMKLKSVFMKSVYAFWNPCLFYETCVSFMKPMFVPWDPQERKVYIVNETDVSWPGFISWGPGCHKNFVMLIQRKQRLHCMLGFFFNINMDRNYLATCGWKLLENLSSCAWDFPY